MTRILIIEGHPDPVTHHFCHALADAYVRGAIEGGHAVRRVQPAAIRFPLLRSQHAWEQGSLPRELVDVQESKISTRCKTEDVAFVSALPRSPAPCWLRERSRSVCGQEAIAARDLARER